MFTKFVSTYIVCVITSAEGEHPLAVRMLSGCQQAVNKLSREKIFFAQTHFLESTNKNTNVNTRISKNKNRRNLLIGYHEAVRMLSEGCRVAVGYTVISEHGKGGGKSENVDFYDLILR